MLTEVQLKQLSQMILDQAIVMNGDKKKLMKSVASIEVHIESIYKLLDTLPCKEHHDDFQILSKDVKDNSIKIEKSKWSMLIALFSFIASLTGVASVIFLWIQISGK